jgi:hypothetical protein
MSLVPPSHPEAEQLYATYLKEREKEITDERG